MGFNMDLEQIEGLFDDTMYVVSRLDGTIVYPNDKNKLLYIRKLITIDDLFYSKEDKRWYEKKVRNISIDNEPYFIYKYYDITNRKHIETNLETDELTGIFNRKKAIKEFDRFIGENNNKDFATIIADIDFFKNVNDTYGHDAGDLVLKKFANIIYSNTRHNDGREKDLIGRFGGEEFLILLKNIEYSDALRRVNAIREMIEDEKVSYNGKNINITCSLGLAHIDSSEIDKIKIRNVEDADNLRALLMKMADQNLYFSKENGRNKLSSSRFL